MKTIATRTIKQLKALAAKFEIAVIGDKREKQTWVGALLAPTTKKTEIMTAELQLNNLREKENELFQLALTNPQESLLEQIQAIWAQRSEIYTQMENAITPMPAELVQSQKVPDESTYCTPEEMQAIPRLDWYQMELWGKKEWQPKSQTYLCKKGIKIPESVAQKYELTPRQVAIFQQEVTLEGLKEVENQDEPCWNNMPSRHHDYDDYDSTRDLERYGYSNRQVIMGWN